MEGVGGVNARMGRRGITVNHSLSLSPGILCAEGVGRSRSRFGFGLGLELGLTY